MRDGICTPQDVRLRRGVCGLWLLFPSRPEEKKEGKKKEEEKTLAVWVVQGNALHYFITEMRE